MAISRNLNAHFIDEGDHMRFVGKLTKSDLRDCINCILDCARIEEFDIFINVMAEALLNMYVERGKESYIAFLNIMADLTDQIDNGCIGEDDVQDDTQDDYTDE